MKFKLIAIAAFVAFFSSYAQAATFSYSVSGVTLSDGSNITGSFDFEDSGSIFSNIMLTLTGANVPTSSSGQPFNGLYDTASFYTDTSIVIFGRNGLTNSGEPALGLVLGTGLDLLVGGNTGISIAGYGNCNSGCPANSFGTVNQSGVNGQLTGSLSVVPLPAALPLYGAGIAILGFLGWRRKNRA